MQCEYCGSTTRPINIIGEVLRSESLTEGRTESRCDSEYGVDSGGKETGRTTVMCHTCEHTGVPFSFSIVVGQAEENEELKAQE